MNVTENLNLLNEAQRLEVRNINTLSSGAP